MKRYSIAALMIVILVVGVAFAALREASDLWAGILLSLTLLLLASALSAIPYRRGGKRAFWFAFALFGWGYLVLSQAPWFSEQVQPRLPTTALLSYIHTKAHPEQSQAGSYLLSRAMTVPVQSWSTPTASVKVATSPATVTGGIVSAAGASTAQTFNVNLVWVQSNLEQFLRIGQCLFVLLVALVGGLVTRWFQRTNGPIPATVPDTRDPAVE